MASRRRRSLIELEKKEISYYFTTHHLGGSGGSQGSTGQIIRRAGRRHKGEGGEGAGGARGMDISTLDGAVSPHIIFQGPSCGAPMNKERNNEGGWDDGDDMEGGTHKEAEVVRVRSYHLIFVMK